MADYSDGYIYATIHDFKTNISRYMRMLQEGRYKGVKVKRYNRVAGIFLVSGGVAAYERLHGPEKGENGKNGG